MPNGKGKLYNKNGKIFYEGDFIKGKFEGTGKIVDKDGYYMICQFKDGICNGKGKIYDKNDNIKGEADFINDNFEGNIKIFMDNDYFIGQIRNYNQEGKAQYVTNDGKSILEGEIINKKFSIENIKYIFEEGKYAIFPYKNNNFKFVEGKIFDEKGNYLEDDTRKFLCTLLWVNLMKDIKDKKDKKCIIC